MGAIPKVEDVGGPADSADETAPAETLARVIAHIFHRTPGVSRIEKRLEGKDKTAGIGSDILALLTQLAQRNAHVLETLAQQQLAAMREAKTAGQKPATAAAPPQEAQQ